MMLLKLVMSNWIYPSYGRAFVWDYQNHFERHEPHFASKKKTCITSDGFILCHPETT